jgi:3-methyladenine DNA glycosylase AlkD
MNSKKLIKILRSLGDPVIAEQSQRYFKTGKGEYGEGDRFLGIRVPVLRAEVKKHPSVPLHEIQQLLTSPFHEIRLFALLLLVREFSKSSDEEKTAIYKLYLSNTQYINNWDLVDSSAHRIIGVYLEDKDKKILYKLAKSDNLWERRIAILSCFHFIGNNQFKDALKLATLLMNDKADLMHKAIGWMLREIGKRDLATEEAFLLKHHSNMPRTMLRYAIERFPERKRKDYMKIMRPDSNGTYLRL